MLFFRKGYNNLKDQIIDYLKQEDAFWEDHENIWKSYSNKQYIIDEEFHEKIKYGKDKQKIGRYYKAENNIAEYKNQPTFYEALQIYTISSSVLRHPLKYKNVALLDFPHLMITASPRITHIIQIK